MAHEMSRVILGRREPGEVMIHEPIQFPDCPHHEGRGADCGAIGHWSWEMGRKGDGASESRGAVYGGRGDGEEGKGKGHKADDEREAELCTGGGNGIRVKEAGHCGFGDREGGKRKLQGVGRSGLGEKRCGGPAREASSESGARPGVVAGSGQGA
jgi:hypothetical protein